jgi:hypothetical protein
MPGHQLHTRAPEPFERSLDRARDLPVQTVIDGSAHFRPYLALAGECPAQPRLRLAVGGCGVEGRDAGGERGVDQTMGGFLRNENRRGGAAFGKSIGQTERRRAQDEARDVFLRHGGRRFR